MLIWLALLLWLFVLLRRIGFAVVKRLRLTAMLKRICAQNRWQYRQNRAAFASFFGFAAQPDIEIETPETLYCIRLFTCVNQRWFLHFPKENVALYTKRYIRLGKRASKSRAVYGNAASERVCVKKMRLLPPMKIPETEKTVERILLFNPAPKEISRVNASRTAAEIVGSGDVVFGQRIYNAKWLEFALTPTAEKEQDYERV